MRVAAIGITVVTSWLMSGAAFASSTLTPPVITEHFTLLPCNKNTTIGMEGCAESQLLALDRRVNKEVALIFTELPTARQKREFNEAENAWFAYRGTDCQSFAAVYEGGSFAPVEYAQCEVRDDQLRSSDLHSLYDELHLGSENPPGWP
jgi:uncharacterized protein YecT (DUF1311 family)